MKNVRSLGVQGSLKSLVFTRLSFLAIAMIIIFLGMNLGAIGGANDNLSKIHPALQEKLSTLSPAEEVIIWVMFKDRPWSKNLAEQSAYLETHYDLPPVNEGYIHQIEGFGFRYRATSELTNEASFEGPAGQVHSLANLPLVAYVSLVEIGTALATPDSHACPGDHEYAYTTYKNRRAMDAIGIVNLHNARRNGSGIKIGIIDSGIKENNDGTGKHEVFSGNVSNGQPKIAAQKDFVRNDNFADDEYGHGTAVAGVAAGFVWYNNNYAYIGAAPDAQLVIAKIADNSGTYYNDLFIKAIKWCVINQSVHIINLSVAWTLETANGYSKPTRWVDWAVKQGKVVVVSMGNDWSGNPGYRSLYAPADNFNGISVGATIPNGSVIEPYSRRGPTKDGRIKPDVVAPGGKWDDANDSNQDSAIAAPATGATNYYIWEGGTSFAAPLVAGGIACMMEANNSLIGDPLAVRTRLWETAVDKGTAGVDSIYGYGLFQATAASNNSYPNVMIRDETQGIEGANATDLGYLPSCDLGTEPETLWSLPANGVGIYQGVQGGDDPFWKSPSIFVDNDDNGVPDDPNQPIAGQANKFKVIVHNIGDAGAQAGQVKVTLYKSNPNTGLTQWDQIGVVYNGSSIPPDNDMPVGPIIWNTPSLNDLGQAHWCIGATVEYLLTRDDKAPLPGQSPAGASPPWDVVKCDNFAIRNFWVQESGKVEIATNPNLLFIVENTTSSTHTITLYKADFLPAGWTSTLSVVSIPNMAAGAKDTVTLTITSTSTGTGYVYVESHTEGGEVLGGFGFALTSQGALVFSDNFNDCDISNWTTYTSSGIFATTTSQYVSPPCGLYMSSMASGYAYGRTPDLYIDTTQDFTITTYFRLPHTANHWFWVLSNGWVELVIDYGPELSAYQGLQGPTLLLDSLNTNQWYHIRTVVHPATSNYDIYLDGLYKVTAKFPGTYLRYLRLGEFENGSYNHGEGYWDDLLVYGKKSYLCGDVNGDGKTDLGDVVYLITFLYKSGPPPHPMESGDVNCNGSVDLGDVVYLITYQYKGGPAPCASCKGGGFSSNASGSAGGQGRAQVSLVLSTEGGSVFGGKADPVSADATRLSKVSPAGMDEVSEIAVMGKFDRDIAGVELEMNFNPAEVTMLDPILTSLTKDLQLYFGTKDGTQKIGIVDISGKSLIPAGEGALVHLRAKGNDLNSIKIRKAILVDADANELALELSADLKQDFQQSKPQEFSLSQNYPNPFNPQTSIRYALPQDAQVKLVIYNVLGEKVKTLVNESQSAGFKTVWWDGKDERGDQVASGIYFYRLEADKFSEVKKMLLMK